MTMTHQDRQVPQVLRGRQELPHDHRTADRLAIPRFSYRRDRALDPRPPRKLA